MPKFGKLTLENFFYIERSIRQGKSANSIPHCNSSIGNHLLNQKCASHYNDNQFFILSKARSDFYLSVLESIFITLCKPKLCKQKEIVNKYKLLV